MKAFSWPKLLCCKISSMKHYLISNLICLSPTPHDIICFEKVRLTYAT